MLRFRVAVLPMLLVGLLALGRPPQALGLQLSDLLTQCRVALRDTSTDTTFQRFSDAKLTAFINEGQKDVQNKTWLLQGYYSFDLTSAIRTYQTPADFLFTLRVMLNNNRLTQTAFNQLDAVYNNWSTATSTSTQYYVDNFVSSVTLIGFYPLPKTTTTGGLVQVQYAKIPQTLVNATDIPFNGRQTLFGYHEVLAHYCAMKGWLAQDRFDIAKNYADLYGLEVATIKTAVNTTPDFNPSASGYNGAPGTH